MGIYTTVDGTVLKWGAPAHPCGLVAKSFFNDTYELYNGTKIDSDYRLYIDETDIAWGSDREHKFKNAENWTSI